MVSGRCPRELLAQIWPRVIHAKPRSVPPPARRNTNARGPLGASAGWFHSPLAAPGRWAHGRQPAARRWVGVPLSPRLGLRLPFNLRCGPLPRSVTPLHPPHRNFPPSNAQPINPILSSNTEFRPRASPSPALVTPLPSENRVDRSNQQRTLAELVSLCLFSPPLIHLPPQKPVPTE